MNDSNACIQYSLSSSSSMLQNFMILGIILARFGPILCPACLLMHPKHCVYKNKSMLHLIDTFIHRKLSVARYANTLTSSFQIDRFEPHKNTKPISDDKSYCWKEKGVI